MKKNIFKFAYIALAVASMFVLGHRRAYAANDCYDDCTDGCEASASDCLGLCIGRDGIACVKTCQSTDDSCKSGCTAKCGGPDPVL